MKLRVRIRQNAGNIVWVTGGIFFLSSLFVNTFPTFFFIMIVVYLGSLVWVARVERELKRGDPRA